VPAERVGIIGLGKLGTAMAERLAGLDPLLYNRTPRAVGRMAASVAELVAGSDLILCVVAGDDATRTVLDDPAFATHPGRLVINMGTVAPGTAVEVAARLAPGTAFVDAPVSGPPASARRGELTILAGGEPDALRRADPVLRLLGSTVIGTGACGTGSAMKAILNRTARTFVDALGAAIDDGLAAGFDADLTYHVLRHSMVASRVLEERPDLVMRAAVAHRA
jgi:3-hydroxyisobutyrate dehydrogenase-like beta-hydroxyacid dehydrogenase